MHVVMHADYSGSDSDQRTSSELPGEAAAAATRSVPANDDDENGGQLWQPPARDSSPPPSSKPEHAQKKRLWTSMTCTIACNKGHRPQDQQQQRYIEPEMSAKTAAGEDIEGAVVVAVRVVFI
ncbi:unnamed protein product [Linum trigynum]|uniref:Uncharacterized protein n=1 Tax=Linum trigynum TaxID=586398 RepID=A0AAV2GU88_9ROSI